MKLKYFLHYFIAISIPVLLGLIIWQSIRYHNLYREMKRFDVNQAEWIESNKRIIADIAEYSSSYRIEYMAKNQLNLKKIKPQNILQVKIVEGKEYGY